MGRLGDEPALSVRRFQARSPAELSEIQWRVARALHVRRSLGDAARGRIAVLGIYLDQAGDHHGDTRRYRREQNRAHGILQARTSRHAVARRGGMDRGGAITRRHCERSQAIHSAASGDVDCFAALAMTVDIVASAAPYTRLNAIARASDRARVRTAPPSLPL